ncbi:MAG: hypothetical protein Q7J24_15510 [Desulfomicrobium sp.]|nr:hypothetical protein [Desulfomicrobium sp.]MDP3430189.1 hypothetical protein [Desulfomicrobium sp.]
MKRILFLTLLFCTVAASAPAAAPEAALQALLLGNEKYALQQSLEPATLAIVVADPAIDVPVADLFGLPESRLVVIKPEGAFGPETSLAVQDSDLTAPLVVILGQDQDAVWAVYANIVQASPDLIHAVLKGQVSAQGAVVDSDGMVTVLGAHPELQTLVGLYLLGAPAPAEPEAAVDAPSEVPAEAVSEGPAEAATEAPAEAAVETVAEEKAAAVQPADDEADAQKTAAEESAVQPENAAASAEAIPAAAEAKNAQSSGGGSGVLIAILFIAALVGTIVYMEKTVLKS